MHVNHLSFNFKKNFCIRLGLMVMIGVLCFSHVSAQEVVIPLLPVHTLADHSAAVNMALYSPDGQTILTVSDDATAILWDTQTGEKLHTLTGHTEAIIVAAFSPDGQTVITGSADDDAILWDVTTGEQRHLLSLHRDDISAVVFAPDGKSVVTASLDESATVWDVETGAYTAILSGHRRAITDVAFSPDGSTILTGSQDRNARLWNARTGRRLFTLEGHERDIVKVAFSPDGSKAFTAGGDAQVRVWDVKTGTQINTLYQGDPTHIGMTITNMTLSPDGTQLFTGSRNYAILWDVETEKKIHVFSEQGNGEIEDVPVAFSSDGQMVLVGGDNKLAMLMDAKTGHLLQIFEGHSEGITSVAISPDNQTVLTASKDGTARLWDIHDVYETNDGNGLPYVFSPSYTFGGDWDIRGVAFTPDSKTVMVTTTDAITLFDVKSGESRREIKIGTSSDWVVRFSPDGQMALTGSASGDRSITLWDLQSGTALHTFNNRTLTQGVFSPDGQTIITISDEKTAILWDVKTGEKIRDLEGEIPNATFSPDGQYILTSEINGNLYMRDIKTNRLVRKFMGLSYRVFSFAFSPDQKLLAAYSGEGFAMVWNAQTGKRIAKFTDEYYSLWFRMAFTPDSQSLLTANLFDTQTHLWDVYSGELIRDLKGSEATLSTDGRLMVGGWDETSWYNVRDTQTNGLVYILRTESWGTPSFSPDGKTVVLVGHDTTLWDISGE